MLWHMYDCILEGPFQFYIYSHNYYSILDSLTCILIPCLIWAVCPFHSKDLKYSSTYDIF